MKRWFVLFFFHIYAAGKCFLGKKKITNSVNSLSNPKQLLNNM